MAVIVYRCSGCNRLLQLRENQRGVTTVGLCTMTEGCRGELVQIDRLQDRTRPAIAERIPDVVNRQPRNVLFNYVQAIEAEIWTVTHNLNSNPVVQVAVDRPGQDERVEIQPQSVEIVDSNTTRITFERPESGVAQFIARASGKSQPTASASAQPTFFQLTANGIMTIAMRTDETSIEFVYIDNAGSPTPIIYNTELAAPPVIGSPWSNGTTIVVNGVEYILKSIDLTNIGGSVNEGEAFYINESYVDATETLILLAQAPYLNADKIKRQLVRPAGIGAAEAISSFVYSQGEHFVVEGLIEEVYPPVFVL